MTADDLKHFSLCPKWGKCSAPACPLDADWHKRALLNDDPVCYYMTEAVKPRAKELFQVAGKEELYVKVSALVPLMSARWARIRRALERSRTKGSRMATELPQKGHGNGG